MPFSSSRSQDVFHATLPYDEFYYASILSLNSESSLHWTEYFCNHLRIESFLMEIKGRMIVTLSILLLGLGLINRPHLPLLRFSKAKFRQHRQYGVPG